MTFDDDPFSNRVTCEPPRRALSVRQPWAWAIFNGKDIENRTAIAVSNGRMEPDRICIHAARGMTREEYEFGRAFMANRGLTCPHPKDLARGALLGTVEVVAIVKKHASPWFMGPRGLVLCEAFLWAAPVPCRGALGYFDLGEEGGYPIHEGERQEPMPWMLAWSPDTTPPAPRERALKPLPLFGGP